MRLLFLDQTAELGGAELSLFAEVTNLPHESSVLLFEDGPLREMLEAAHVPVEVVHAAAGAMTVRTRSGALAVFLALPAVIRLVLTVAARARDYDVIYANSQKAFVVGALASAISRCPLVWRLRDVLSAAHFSTMLRRVVILLANWQAARIIPNSRATGAAFAAAGGNAERVSIAYPGIDESAFSRVPPCEIASIRAELGAENGKLIGVFGRLSLWKGQAMFVDAIAQIPDVIGVIVGAPLFGHAAFEAALTAQVAALGLERRVRFLGFRNDIPALMNAMDIIVHSSTAPEPFGRVVVEGMLAGKPMVASAAGGVLEIIEHGKTGWLYPPGDAAALAQTLRSLLENEAATAAVAQAGQLHARATFTIPATVRQICNALSLI